LVAHGSFPSARCGLLRSVTRSNQLVLQMQPIQIVVLCLLYLLPVLGSGQIDQTHVKETWDYMAEKKPYSSVSFGLTDYALQVDPYSAYGYGEALVFSCEGIVNRTALGGEPDPLFVSNGRSGYGHLDSTEAPIWRRNVYLGAQAFIGLAWAGSIEFTKRHGRRGHSASLSYCQAIRRLQPEDFNPRWLPFQLTYFQGGRHNWEMGLGAIYADGAFYQKQLPNETLRGRTFFITWLPIGYRFDGFNDRLKVRVYPNLIWTVYEANGPYRDYLVARRRDNVGERLASFCISIGWGLKPGK